MFNSGRVQMQPIEKKALSCVGKHVNEVDWQEFHDYNIFFKGGKDGKYDGAREDMEFEDEINFHVDENDIIKSFECTLPRDLFD